MYSSHGRPGKNNIKILIMKMHSETK